MTGPPHGFGGPNPIEGQPPVGGQPQPRRTEYTAPSGPPPMPPQGPPTQGPPPGAYQGPPPQQFRSPTPGWAGGPGNGPPQFAPPGKSRRPLVLTIIAAVTVVVIAVVVGVVALSGDGESSGGGGDSDAATTAAGAVRGYLEALARGDAKAALSFGVKPPDDTRFLTDDVLKKQIAKAPITDIRILNEASSADGKVHATAKFGGKSSDVTMYLDDPSDGRWKLKQVAYNVGFGKDYGSYADDEKAMKSLTLFGEPIENGDPVWVFPGGMEFGSSNANIQVDSINPEPEIFLDQLQTEGYTMNLFFQFALTDSGSAAALTALKPLLDKCAGPVASVPVGCPTDIMKSGIVDSTIVWKAPADTGDMRVGYMDAKDLTASLTGGVDFPYTAQSPTGAPISDESPQFVNATCDFSTSPPTVTLKPQR